MKVIGPFHSDDASGSFAGCIVAAKWKGVKYLRQLVTPRNAETEDQAVVRLILGGLGRTAGKVNVTSAYEAQMITLGRIPSGQSKQSALVKFCQAQFMVDSTAYEAIYTAFEAHAAKADFTSQAGSIGLADLDIAYKGAGTHVFSKGMMLYVLARAGIAYEFTGTPYTDAIASWDAADVTALVADLAAV